MFEAWRFLARRAFLGLADGVVTLPMVRRVLYSFSRVEVWCSLLERKLVDAAVPKSAPTAQLLDAIG